MSHRCLPSSQQKYAPFGLPLTISSCTAALFALTALVCSACWIGLHLLTLLWIFRQDISKANLAGRTKRSAAKWIFPGRHFVERFCLRRVMNTINSLQSCNGIMWVLVISLHWAAVGAAFIPRNQHAGSTKVNGQPCAKCAREQLLSVFDESDLVQLRIEIIKEQILQNFQLEKKPVLESPQRKNPPRLPESFLRNSSLSTDEEPPEKIELQTVLLFPVESHNQTLSNSSLVFSITEDMKTFTLESAVLWTPKPSGEEISWLSTDVTSSVEQQINRESENIVLRRDFFRSTQHKPYLVVQLNEERKRNQKESIGDLQGSSRRRQKRSTPSCSGSSSDCCRESLYISFRDIGWDDWIIAPQGFQAYFCRGSCRTAASGGSRSASAHAALLQRLLSRNAIGSDIRPQLTPCCSPTRLSPMTVFYMEGSDVVKQRVLPNMIVDSCACAL